MADKEFDSIFERKLKKFSITQIEEAIAKAVSDLAGEEYEVDIKSIDYEPFNMASMYDQNEVQLAIKRCNTSDEGIPF